MGHSMKAVIGDMEKVWERNLEMYYNSIVEVHVINMSEKYSLNKDELREYLNSVKSTIIGKPSLATETVKTKKAKTVKKQDPPSDNGIYSNHSRNDIINLCKQRNLTRRRKTQDMIDSLLLFDTQNTPSTSSQPQPSSSYQQPSSSSPQQLPPQLQQLHPQLQQLQPQQQQQQQQQQLSTDVPQVSDNENDSDIEPSTSNIDSDDELNEESYI